MNFVEFVLSRLLVISTKQMAINEKTFYNNVLVINAILFDKKKLAEMRMVFSSCLFLFQRAYLI